MTDREVAQWRGPKSKVTADTESHGGHSDC